MAVQQGRSNAKRRGVPMGYVERLRFATRRIRSVTFANAAELVRRQCLARTMLADFFSILLYFLF